MEGGGGERAGEVGRERIEFTEGERGATLSVAAVLKQDVPLGKVKLTVPATDEFVLAHMSLISHVLPLIPSCEKLSETVAAGLVAAATKAT